MSEAGEILRSYIRLVGRLSGAASVSLYVPPGSGGESEILIHEGRLEPLPELTDAKRAEEFQNRIGAETASHDESTIRLTSRLAGGILCRIPLRWVTLRPEEEVQGPERRKRDERPREEMTALIGMRFEADAATDPGPGRPGFPTATDNLGDESWWKEFLGIAAAFATHSRTLSRTLLDQVTGLPERPEFQAQLEAALTHAKRTGLPSILLLLGPDDFGWVNERLDRRSGDIVLREIATALRAGLRSHDHVARYGGAIFTVILHDMPIADGRMVAESLVHRLGDQRYHGGLLRLEFSVGVAVGDPEIPPPELLRRADQALSAAKRGHAGSVRIWEKGSDVEHAGSLDRLQGIFTGDKAKDYRNMGLLLDSVVAVAASTDSAQLARSFTERLFGTLNARRVAVLERSAGGTLELLSGMEKAGEGGQVFQVTERDLAIVERACQDRSFVSETRAEGEGLLLCAIPLSLRDRCLGGIVLEVASAHLSFEGSDRRFLDALASQMAVALDRARLIERERQRQQREKERLETEVKDLQRVIHSSRLAYRSPAMESVVATARKVASTDTTVLITGESGTGKEMLAHTLHELSSRSEKPFVVIDCSAISPTLIDSELFGHEKGAFTGAHARKPGRLAQAQGATVFLDEIGDLPLDLQSKLLRFVQEKQFTPVGSVVARTVDVQIIAATNADLRVKVRQGKFREDLFHRLNVVWLHVPPLRERREDILHLAGIFLHQFAALYRRPAHHFTSKAERALLAHPWPGNVRELENLILTSVLFCDAPEVDEDDLEGLRSTHGPPQRGPARMTAPPALTSFGEAVVRPESSRDGLEPAARLRKALADEIAAALSFGQAGLIPIGKWLAEDLILTADRLAGGISRRGAELLGLPDTTYRRQLQSAARNRAAGISVRSACWPAVLSVLEDFIQARQAGTDACQWAEACLLVETKSAAPGDLQAAAALLGVTEPTLLRRMTQLAHHF
ncbi:MAG TPA: sigma 54-interacting transcriptional regulator [Vicinamibacteria bacterium]|nr:sigma 54-interacting transcriptional regulator [Vicinamibacteria bacterium]